MQECATDAASNNRLRSDSASSLHCEPMMERSLNSLNSSTSSLASLASNGGPSHRPYNTTPNGISAQTSRKLSGGSTVSGHSPKARQAAAAAGLSTVGSDATTTTPAPLAAQVHQYQSNWDARETSGIVVNESTPEPGNTTAARHSANLTDVWSV